jgi:hypothetical protein
MKTHRCKYVIIAIVAIISTSQVFSKNKSKKWFEPLGLQSSLGYSQYFQKRGLKPSDTYKFIKLRDVSYKLSICYKYSLNKKVMLQPYIGYSYFHENTWTHGYDLWIKFYTSAFIVGCSVNYQLKKFFPKFGICANRIANRKFVSLIPYYSYDMELDTRNLIQTQLGLDYGFDKFRIGFEYDRGITFITPSLSAAHSYSFNYFGMTFTYYPFIKLGHSDVR